MSQEIAAARFVALGGPEAGRSFLDGLRADVLSALATRPSQKVYAASFDPDRDPEFSGHVLAVAAVCADARFHALVSVRAPDGAPQAEALDLPAAHVASAAERIASVVLRLLGGRTRARSPVESMLSQPAYERLLRARHHAASFTPADNEVAIGLFQEVLAEAPDHAPALSGLARATFEQVRYGVLDASHYATVREAAERAIDADPEAVQAHVTRALVAMYHDRDFRAAADAFGDALALDRDHVDVLGEYAWLLCATGHDAEAAAAIDRAREYDPLSLSLLCTRASLARYAGDAHEALAFYREARGLDLRYARAIEGIASMSAALGDRDEAYRYLDLYRRHAPTLFWRFRPMGEIAALFGDETLFARAERGLLDYAREHPEADLSGDLASIYAGRDPDRAMRHLTDAYRRGIGMVSVLRYPVFAPLFDRDDYRMLIADLDLDIDVPEVAAARTQVLRLGEGAEAVTLPKTAFVVAEAQRNYVTVHAARGTRRTQHLLRTSLTALAEGVADGDLVRVHHSFVANLGLPGWRLDGNAHTATLRLDRLDVEVPVSRAKYRDVRVALAA